MSQVEARGTKEEEEEEEGLLLGSLVVFSDTPEVEVPRAAATDGTMISHNR